MARAHRVRAQRVDGRLRRGRLHLVVHDVLGHVRVAVLQAVHVGAEADDVGDALQVGGALGGRQVERRRAVGGEVE